MKLALLIPTLNAGARWIELLDAVAIQQVEFSRKIIIDSGSTDQTVILARKHGFEVLTIDKKEFDHGYARQLLADAASECDILVYLTQDSLLNGPDAVQRLVAAFKDDHVGIAYGRQLPNTGAKVLEKHARLFNYPSDSITKKLSDKDKLGIVTASNSNSYAAYRSVALSDVAGFPMHTIMGEDVIVGGKMLIKGWKIAYVGDSEVFHSHAYSLMEEFRRYFDIGVYHSTNKWLLDEFGKPEGEGLRYVMSEFKYVLKNNILVLPKMMASIGVKFIGYKLGVHHNILTLPQKKKFSMHTRFWSRPQVSNQKLQDQIL